jgi:hypothetical protein
VSIDEVTRPKVGMPQPTSSQTRGGKVVPRVGPLQVGPTAWWDRRQFVAQNQIRIAARPDAVFSVLDDAWAYPG